MNYTYIFNAKNVRKAVMWTAIGLFTIYGCKPTDDAKVVKNVDSIATKRTIDSIMIKQGMDSLAREDSLWNDLYDAKDEFWKYTGPIDSPGDGR